VAALPAARDVLPTGEVLAFLAAAMTALMLLVASLAVLALRGLLRRDEA
jgi:hypothetical protein